MAYFICKNRPRLQKMQVIEATTRFRLRNIGLGYKGCYTNRPDLQMLFTEIVLIYKRKWPSDIQK